MLFTILQIFSSNVNNFQILEVFYVLYVKYIFYVFYKYLKYFETRRYYTRINTLYTYGIRTVPNVPNNHGRAYARLGWSWCTAWSGRVHGSAATHGLVAHGLNFMGMIEPCG